MPLLFSYGTLQQTNVQLSTFGRRLEGHVDELPGFVPSLVSIEDPDVAATTGTTYHANVTFTGSKTDSVRGAVFKVSEDELAAADAYERRAAYKRIAARLASGQRAWVYVDSRSAPHSA